MAKIIIIANPVSGQEKGETKAFELAKLLEKENQNVTVRLTVEENDAIEFAQIACEEKVDQVYFLGGDGTFSQGMKGIAANDYRPQIGFVPVGTVNNLARMLGLALDEEDVISQFAQRTTFKMDIGQVNDDYFISTITAGSLPGAFESVDNNTKAELGMFAFVMGGLKALNQEETDRFQFTLDIEKYSEEYDMIVIGLGNSVASVPTFFENARLDDGHLNLFGLKNTDTLEKFGALFEVLREEKSQQNENVDYFKFKHAYINRETGNGSHATVDGDAGPQFPLEIKVLPEHLEVIIPTRTRYSK